MKVDFNVPYLTGNELKFISEAISNGHLSGNGPFTQNCHRFFEEQWGIKKGLLTTSCTDALEMCSLLLNIGPGDEIIVPSYTFVSTALAFARQGADIIFAESRIDHPGIDEEQIELLVTSRTKAIIVVHYAGVACDMDKIMELARIHNLWVIEDAAHAIDSFYKGKRLGTIGHLGCFSFHETKNIHCGEGGLLVINDDRFIQKAEIIWEKGTNRAAFNRKETNKYEWLELGSSFLPSDILAAFLWAQLVEIDKIQSTRIKLWNWYNEHIDELLDGFRFKKPVIPDYTSINGHMYYVVCDSETERQRIIKHLNTRGIYPLSHYLCLHKSPYYSERYIGPILNNSLRYEQCILRLPFYNELTSQLDHYTSLFNS